MAANGGASRTPGEVAEEEEAELDSEGTKSASALFVSSVESVRSFRVIVECC